MKTEKKIMQKQKENALRSLPFQNILSVHSVHLVHIYSVAKAAKIIIHTHNCY